ncbi:hypothetical protein BGX30_004966 [Mortierella sp. GBA39]|nr:hypothetical protein BGX30_004966 [Mortierella sp. GBA39]
MEESVKHESCGTGERKSHHSPKTKNNLISRLNRIEGQIRGIKGLIEKDTYCDDVLNQISSVQSALNGVSKLLLEHHMKSCLIERIQDGENEVNGMSCMHCVNSIEGAMKALGADAKVNLADGTVTVAYDSGKLSLQSIKEAIEDQGYEVA